MVSICGDGLALLYFFAQKMTMAISARTTMTVGTIIKTMAEEDDEEDDSVN